MAFAVWDSAKLSAVALDGTSLIATASGAGGAIGQGTNRTGKWYWEITLGSVTASSTVDGVGVCLGAASAAGLTAQTSAIIYTIGGTVRSGGAQLNASIGAIAAGSVVGIALDLDNALIWFRLGAAGNWNGSATNNPATGVGGISIAGLARGPAYDWYPAFAAAASGNTATANFGSSAFTGTAPSGFTAGWTTAAAVTNLTATTVGREAWLSEQPGPLRATKIGYEAWFNIVPAALATRIGREIWMSSRSSTARKRRVMAISSV